MYSETDASEMRKDELDVSLDNVVIDRLENAFVKNKDEETKQFSHKRDKKLSQGQRKQAMAKSFINWFDKD